MCISSIFKNSAEIVRAYCRRGWFWFDKIWINTECISDYSSWNGRSGVPMNKLSDGGGAIDVWLGLWVRDSGWVGWRDVQYNLPLPFVTPHTQFYLYETYVPLSFWKVLSCSENKSCMYGGTCSIRISKNLNHNIWAHSQNIKPISQTKILPLIDYNSPHMVEGVFVFWYLFLMHQNVLFNGGKCDSSLKATMC